MPFVPALAAAVLAMAASAAAAQAPEEVVAQLKSVSCTAGPYRLKLPPTYPALRTLGPIKREKTLRVEEGKMELRSLRFNGLEFVVLVDPRKPNAYQVVTATFSNPRWRIAGPLRVGAPLATALKGVAMASVPRDAELTLEGEGDSILLTVLAGRIQQVEYDCGGE
jgi:hypothetical protein